MQISMKCSVAVHCLIFIHEFQGDTRVTSSLLAKSTGLNPVVVRNIISSLKKAGLITVPMGTGGAELCMEPSEITLYQIYSAVEPNGIGELIAVHQCSERPCPVAQNIGNVLKTPYRKIEDAVCDTMKQISLESMIEDYHAKLADKT